MRQSNGLYRLMLTALGIGLSGCGGGSSNDSLPPPPVENQRAVTVLNIVPRLPLKLRGVKYLDLQRANLALAL